MEFRFNERRLIGNTNLPKTHLHSAGRRDEGGESSRVGYVSDSEAGTVTHPLTYDDNYTKGSASLRNSLPKSFCL